MAITGHTGIPPFLNVFATPSVSIAATTEAPYCSGADVTFNATIVAPALQYLNTYYFTINGITASGKVLTMTTNSLVDGDVVRFVMVHKNGSVYYSNSIVAEIQSCTTEINYGLLYNWYAATDARGFTSSDDWYIPPQSDVAALKIYCTNVSNALKETGTIWWLSPNAGATNEFSFNARGSGRRTPNYYIGLLEECYYWTTTNIYGNNYFMFRLQYQYNEFLIDSSEAFNGLSIRLVRPATIAEQLLDDGTYCDPYVQNDGKLLPTVKIGTQIWTAANSAETKYRNGDWIHGFDGGVYTPISNTDWANLTSAGVCVYDNNLAYL